MNAPILRTYPVVLQISAKAHEKFLAYVRALDVEINGFAYVNKVSNSLFIIEDADDVFITKQEVSVRHTVSDAVGNALAYDRAAQCGRDDQLRVQWHSHVNGPARFSTTDIKTMDVNEHAGMAWGISVVLNKRGDFEARFDLYHPIRTFVMMEVVIVDDISPELDALVRQEIAELVEIKKPEPVRPSHRRRYWVKEDDADLPVAVGEIIYGDEVGEGFNEGPVTDYENEFTPILSAQDFMDVFGDSVDPDLLDRIKYSAGSAEEFFEAVQPFDTEFSTTKERS